MHRALAEDHDVGAVAAESGDVVAHPRHGESLVLDPEVARAAAAGRALDVLRGEEPEDLRTARRRDARSGRMRWRAMSHLR